MNPGEGEVIEFNMSPDGKVASLTYAEMTFVRN